MESVSKVYGDDQENEMTKAEKNTFESDLGELASAEEFLDYFKIEFDPKVLQVSRLHILQRFHDYLKHRAAPGEARYDDYKSCLTRAYEDFVASDALTEKVFRVFKRAAGIATVPVSAVGRARP